MLRSKFHVPSPIPEGSFAVLTSLDRVEFGSPITHFCGCQIKDKKDCCLCSSGAA